MLGRKAIVLLLFSIVVGIGLLLFTSTLQFANAAGRECSSPYCTECTFDTLKECRDCYTCVQWLIFKECTYAGTYCGACLRMC